MGRGPEMLLCERCMVIRTDDHGTTYLLLDNLTEEQADICLAKFSGHKQSYSKIIYTATSRAKVISDYGIVE